MNNVELDRNGKYLPDINFENEFNDLQVIPQGVIHVGSFSGLEIEYYKRVGFQIILIMTKF